MSNALLKLRSPNRIYDPASTQAIPNGRYSRTPFPGNLIPADRIDPVAEAIQSYNVAAGLNLTRSLRKAASTL